MTGNSHEVAINALQVHLVDIKPNLATKNTFVFRWLKAGLTNTLQDNSTLAFYLCLAQAPAATEFCHERWSSEAGDIPLMASSHLPAH